MVGLTESTDFSPYTSGGSYSQSCSNYETYNCTYNSSSNIITTANTSNIIIGSFVTGNGIPSGTIVTSILNSTSFQVSSLPTSNQTSVLNFSYVDGLIVKLSPQHEILWSTCFGGPHGSDGITDLDINLNGDLSITGWTTASDFPIHEFDQNSSTDYLDATLSGTGDAFIAKFNNDGELIYSTYYGGSGDERGLSGYWFDGYQDKVHSGGSIISDATGNIIVLGSTSSTDQSLVQASGGALQQTSNSGREDLFLSRFSPNLERKWATYFGSVGAEWGEDLEIDPAGILYVIGTASTWDQNYGTYGPSPFIPGPINYLFDDCKGNYDAFVMALSPYGRYMWGTFFGGSEDDFGYCGVAQKGGNKYLSVFGATHSPDFIQRHPWSPDHTYNQYSIAGNWDAFCTVFHTLTLNEQVIGVPEFNSSSNSLNVFPNPSSNSINIQIPKVNAEATLKILNIYGQLLNEYKINEYQNQILELKNTSVYESGLYFIEFISKTGRLTAKFIKE